MMGRWVWPPGMLWPSVTLSGGAGAVSDVADADGGVDTGDGETAGGEVSAGGKEAGAGVARRVS
jgi:hypothetical protein